LRRLRRVSDVLKTKDFERTKVVDIVKGFEKNEVLYVRIPVSLKRRLGLSRKTRFAVYYDGKFIIYEPLPYGGELNEEG